MAGASLFGSRIVKSRTTWVTGAVLLFTVLLIVLRLVVSAYRERAAVEAIRAAGGRVELVYRGSHNRVQTAIAGLLPTMWRIGIFDHATIVSDQSSIRDARKAAIFAQHLPYLPELAHLQLRGPPIDDRHCSALQNSYSLWSLGLDDTSITDAGIESIGRLKHLRSLSLTGARISDRALEVLARLPAIESLSLDDTDITDAGLEKLSQLKSLRQLSISQTDTSDAAIDRLHDAIPGVQITDD